MDDKLCWKHHIAHCKSKLLSGLYAINKIKSFVPIDALLNLYYTLVYPHLLYGIILWGSTYNVYLNNLFLTQKRIIRAICNTPRLEHTLPLFSNLRLLTLRDIYYRECAKYMYNYTRGSLPSSLHNTFIDGNSVHNYETRNAAQIRSYRIRTTKTANSLLMQGPKIWNEIPSDIQTKPNLNSFSSSLKRHILQGYAAAEH